MNNAQIHQAKNEVKGWEKLSTQAKIAFFRWKSKANECWTPRHEVTVSDKRDRVYQFESLEDAEKCLSWWNKYFPGKYGLTIK